MTNAIVCGAGAAGLAAAATLGSKGVNVTVLERSDAVGASWRSRYDGLRLNTTGWMSTLPGYRATTRKYGEFPTRDNWVKYLEDYTAHHQIQVRFGTQVDRIIRGDDTWLVETDGDSFPADIVVMATGYDHEPELPDWPGRDGFTGELLHSSDYLNPEPYRSRDVLVIGPGTTGSEVACFLAKGGVDRVRMACRTAPSLTSRKFLGTSVNVPGIVLKRLPLRVADQVSWLTQLAMFGRLDQYGLPRAPVGLATTLMIRHRTPAYDSGFVDEVKAGRIEVVPAVVGFDGADVLLADGSRIQPDAVIAATGYRRGLEALVGHLGVLGEDGLPLTSGGRQHPSAPGLFFNGYKADLTGQLRLMRFGARGIARTVRRS